MGPRFHTYVHALIETHPRTSEKYLLPFFRCTIKVHKTPAEVRPITGNQRWITQPIAEPLAELLQPYVTRLAVWVKDTDQINRMLDTLEILEDAFLLTYDIVRLYPSIDHELCYRLLREYLHEQGCEFTEFVVSALKIVLNRNYCLFDSRVYRQHIGFATGIACGGEVANLFIFVLTRHVFQRYTAYILNHDRYIDDGFIIWIGTAALAAAMLAELNALNVHIGLTYELSQRTAIFLDLTIFTGRRFQTKRLLDTKCYQKPMNRYLFMPFNSEHPVACKLSIVHGELRRYIKRSSARDDYIGLAGLLRQRLHLRGFPFWFLAKAFASAPRYEQRSDLLALKPSSNNDMPTIVLATTFSRQLLNSGLSRAIFKNQHMLGSQRVDWRAVKFMSAWRAGFKLGKSIIAFQFPKPVRKRDSSSKSGTGPKIRTENGPCLNFGPKISLDEATVSSAAGSDNPRAHTEATTPNPSYSEDLRYGEAAASKQLAYEAKIDQ